MKTNSQESMLKFSRKIIEYVREEYGVEPLLQITSDIYEQNLVSVTVQFPRNV